MLNEIETLLDVSGDQYFTNRIEALSEISSQVEEYTAEESAELFIFLLEQLQLEINFNMHGDTKNATEDLFDQVVNALLRR